MIFWSEFFSMFVNANQYAALDLKLLSELLKTFSKCPMA